VVIAVKAFGINRSYAEYARAPVANVALIESGLPWERLAVIPETYATAWTCLFRNLELAQGQTLLIRGATSSFEEVREAHRVMEANEAGGKMVVLGAESRRGVREKGSA
jgi:hypothetical protein